MSSKRIANRLDVSPSSVMLWTADIALTPAQIHHNLHVRGPQSPEVIARRVEASRRTSRHKRMTWQEEGRHRARENDPLHHGGCMLYWAEGSKSRNSAQLVNSDPHMVRFFRRFLTRCFGVTDDRVRLSLYVYLRNGLTLEEVEPHWLAALALPPACVRKHHIDPRPTSSSGKRGHKLPFGVCKLTVHSTAIVQHIYGAIQEYGGFEEPRWLDGPPRRSRATGS